MALFHFFLFVRLRCFLFLVMVARGVLGFGGCFLLFNAASVSLVVSSILVGGVRLLAFFELLVLVGRLLELDH